MPGTKAQCLPEQCKKRRKFSPTSPGAETAQGRPSSHPIDKIYTAKNVKERGPETAAVPRIPKTNPTLQMLMRGQDREVKGYLHVLQEPCHRNPAGNPECYSATLPQRRPGPITSINHKLALVDNATRDRLQPALEQRSFEPQV